MKAQLLFCKKAEAVPKKVGLFQDSSGAAAPPPVLCCCSEASTGDIPLIGTQKSTSSCLPVPSPATLQWSGCPCHPEHSWEHRHPPCLHCWSRVSVRASAATEQGFGNAGTPLALLGCRGWCHPAPSGSCPSPALAGDFRVTTQQLLPAFASGRAQWAQRPSDRKSVV